MSTAVLLDQVTQLVVDVLLSAANLLQGLPDVLLQFVQVALERREQAGISSTTKPPGGATHPHKMISDTHFGFQEGSLDSIFVLMHLVYMDPPVLLHTQQFVRQTCRVL